MLTLALSVLRFKEERGYSFGRKFTRRRSSTPAFSMEAKMRKVSSFYPFIQMLGPHGYMIHFIDLKERAAIKDLTFELKAKKAETFVLFTHANWKKPDEFMRHYSTKWAT
jgi:hypothetical protein